MTQQFVFPVWRSASLRFAVSKLHRYMGFNPSRRRIGMFATPYFILFEAAGCAPGLVHGQGRIGADETQGHRLAHAALWKRRLM
jgi:hypothetical protein